MTEKPSMQSRYSLSSTSQTRAPFARLTIMGNGSANRKTLPTPAGMTVRFRCQAASDFGHLAAISPRYVSNSAAILS